MDTSKGIDQAPAYSGGTRITVLRDWRQLCYAERGARGGYPIFVCHDLPGSRLQQHPDRALAVNLGARLIYIDRPGFGMSTAHVGRGFADGASDIAQLADALGLGSFALSAVGGGAPYALACAAMMPERVSAVAIASTYVPPDFIDRSVDWRLRAKLIMARRAPNTLRAMLKKSSFRARHDPYYYLDRWVRHLGACDTETLTHLDLLGQYEQDTREAFRQATSGVRSELHALAHPWGIEIEKIRCPLRFWHGSLDRVTPVAVARSFVTGLPNAYLAEVEDAGHFVWYQKWPAMLEFLLPQQSNRLEA